MLSENQIVSANLEGAQLFALLRGNGERARLHDGRREAAYEKSLSQTMYQLIGYSRVNSRTKPSTYCSSCLHDRRREAACGMRVQAGHSSAIRGAEQR